MACESPFPCIFFSTTASSLPTSWSTMLRAYGRLQVAAKMCFETCASMPRRPFCHDSIQHARKECNAKAAQKADQAALTLALREMDHTDPAIFRCTHRGSSKVKSAKSIAVIALKISQVPPFVLHYAQHLRSKLRCLVFRYVSLTAIRTAQRF